MRRFNICALVALALLARSVFGQEAPVADGAPPMPPVAAAAPATIDPLPPAPPTPSAEDLMAAKREQLKALLSEIDQLQQGAQIVLKFEVFDISTTRFRAAGLDWRAVAYSSNHPAATVADVIGHASKQPPSSNDAFGAGMPAVWDDGKAMLAFVELMRRERVLETLAAPRLMVLSGQKASIGMNEDVPAPVAALPDSVGKARVGMDLSVAPKLDPLGRIQVDFRFKLSRLRDGEPILVNGKPYPRTETREVSSSVSLADGQVAILGPWPETSPPAAPAKEGAEPDARERYLLITASTLKPTDNVRTATLFTPRPLPAQVPPRADDKLSDKPARIFNLPYRR